MLGQARPNSITKGTKRTTTSRSQHQMINFHFMKGPLWSLPCLIPDTLQIISVWKSIYISFETHLPIPTGRILFTFFVSLTDSSGGLKCKTFCKMCSCKNSAENLQRFCRFFFAIFLQIFCNFFAIFLQIFCKKCEKIFKKRKN